ncbi:sigma factor-like helix-turn-helix DNA-binding protein [Arthrobacter sp. H20]|uniref:sigma factor-like helix-turn-helix DNA-binding protein n=1 Tax=Arthrobacter sp. H20 TaxID=1267981 RepID=UPI0004AEA8DB|nr:sigma factor-like helix-turn-helix DNA-binding protein [Arthrobacter sp. H20]
MPLDSSGGDWSGLGLLGLGIYGLGLIAIGTALIISAVVLPSVKEVEFGFPVGVKVTTAVSNREDALRQEFDRQRCDLEMCAQLLCDDAAIASHLLEASWSKATTAWRGPVTQDLRTFVICNLVGLVAAHHRWASGPVRSGAVTSPLLSGLDRPERTAVVLHDFAGLSSRQIAAITDRSIDQVRADLRTGTAKAEAHQAMP